MRRYLLFVLALCVLCGSFHAGRSVDVRSHVEIASQLRSLGAFEEELHASLSSARGFATPRDCQVRLEALDLEVERLLVSRSGAGALDSGTVRAELEGYRAEIQAIRPRLEAFSVAQEGRRDAQQVLVDRHRTLLADLPVESDRSAGAIAGAVSAALRSARVLGANGLDATARDLSQSSKLDSNHAAAIDSIVDAIGALSAASRAVDSAREDLNLGRLSAFRLRSVEGLEEALVTEQQGRSFYRVAVYVFLLLLLVLIVHELRAHESLLGHVAQMREALEARVRRRTAQLSKKNERLAQEIRERREAEAQLVAARRAAESASQTKSEFLANMSHEIRTPMTSILGYAERLGDEDLGDGERRDAVETIQRNGQYLLQLINDILDLSKIEAGKLILERIPCSPVQVVLDVQRAVEVRAQSKGLEFAIEMPARIPEAIVTDPTRLKQVLINLLGNAIKFTERGSVTLRVKCISGPAEGGVAYLAFEVEDTGIGMDAAQLNQLFRPFTQADSSTTRKFGGTGLGLSICRTLVQCMGGTMEVESRPGAGSRFSFRVETGSLDAVRWIDGEGIAQLRLGLEAERLRESGARIHGRILLAEDGVDNQRLLTHYLTRAGAEVEVAVDGHKAVESALAAQASGRPFHLIVMDMQMPRLDGYGATARLRAAGYRRPIVALTANAMAHDRKRCLEAGCDDFCSKPVDKYRFLSIVARWISSVPDAGAAPGKDSLGLARTMFRTLAEASTRLVDPPSALPRKAAAVSVSSPRAERPGERLEPSPSSHAADPVPAKPMVSGTPGTRVDEDDPELTELVKLFISDLSRDLDRLTEALEKGDLERVAFLGHQIKGSSGSYGFPSLSLQAARLERCAKGELEGTHVEIELEHFARLCRRLQAGEV